MIDDIKDNIRDIANSSMLETTALLVILATIIMSLTASILTIFELWTASRVVATLTMISLMVSFILLTIRLLLNRGEWTQ
jgi:hypothetical protein